MPFAAAVSEHPVPAEAAGAAIGDVIEQIGRGPDVAAVFVTAPLVGALEDVGKAVRELLAPGVLIGGTAVSVVGGAREIEETAGISLWAGNLPGLAEPPHPVSLAIEQRSADTFELTGAGRLTDGAGTLLLLADPFTFPVDHLLQVLAQSAPQLTVVGGLASAAQGPGGNRLLLDDQVNSAGAVGILFPPGPHVTTLVSQGCRPVGDPFTVTDAQGTMVKELAGQPAFDRLNQLVEHSTAETRAQMAHGLQMGLVIDEQRDRFGRGDFLIRNLVGVDRDNGALAVGDNVEVGSTVQFQVRDAASADEDLTTLLADAGASWSSAPDGALLFTCNGRGERLFGTPDHDAAEVAEHLANPSRPALGGMFCAGEVGPVGGRNFLHGFTASVAMFHDDPPEDPAV